MTEPEPPAEPVAWEGDDTPRSARFGDVYYAGRDGPSESAHVFLAGNGLPDRFAAMAPGTTFRIGELGFGTGLNFLVTLSAWRASAGRRGPDTRLRFTSFERFPMQETDRHRALTVWPEIAVLWPAWGMCIDRRQGWQHHVIDDVELRLAIGDAAALVPTMRDNVDAWYLDGFSPARNPALWSAALMRDVAARTAAGGTIATFTAAGWVRRNLAAARFEVTRSAGFGRKRHMTQGFLLSAIAADTSCQTAHGSA
ncbi:MAG: tRNA (5-methylaminomethyl-2-thiouridine)(34)-methyltransferase MnmD [Pseudomonadota bacterium]